MADAESTGASVLSDSAPLLNLIPYAGPILGAAASIGGGLLQSGAAKKQAAQAAQIRQNALNTQVEPLRPEYLAALHLEQMRSLGGLPGLQTDKNDLAQQLADQIRYIRMAAPGGNQALAAMSKAVATNSSGLRGLQAQDLTYRGTAQTGVVNALNTLGAEGVTKEAVRDTQRTQGLTAAAALENASMLDKQGAYNQGAKGIVGGANSLFQNLLKIANIPATGTNTTSTLSPQTSYGPDTNQNLYYPPTNPTPLLDNSGSNSDNQWMKQFMTNLHQNLNTTSPGDPIFGPSLNAGDATRGVGSQSNSSNLFGTSLGSGNNVTSSDFFSALAGSSYVPPISSSANLNDMSLIGQ